MNHFIDTGCINPWRNLALEELLFERTGGGTCLYLWQNQNTVVIGRNQNAWKECRIEALEAAGGRLARRSSGGGAVFHDMGNLNFTFITPRAAYDLRRQLGVIIQAVRSLGIAADFTGRNDIVTDSGAKFSGNAFRYSQETGMHHGTILVDVDMSKLSAYLMPSKAKLAAKGVESVRSRVCNLAECVPGLTVAAVRQAVMAAFEKEYGAYTTLQETDLDQNILEKKQEKYSSWEWRMGSSPTFDLELETRFAWGGITLQLALSQGRILDAHVYSDAMDEAFILGIPAALRNVRFAPEELAAAASELGGAEGADLADWLRQVQI
ncbi:MAG: lipoate--protein ligase [Clostridia bacterium]|nr:lipoate--protein ligase [Candidatus Pelethousia sp.]NCB29895.1 lipoate--protein ligase [Clostridia bacterium]